jgi:MerR family transcriptional regulator, light-induced transcriptional regulator
MGMSAESGSAELRIGELSRRVGVSDHVLRAWERRYQILRPVRSPGGYRLYSAADERRVRRMQERLAGGISPAEAARAILAEEPALAPDEPEPEPGPWPGAAGPAGDLAAAARVLARRLDDFDEPAAQAVLDRLFAEYTVETVLRDVLLPYLADLGRQWADGTVSIADEHLVSNLIRGRLAGLARGWGAGAGPRAVLACPPGERHDLALLAFGIVLFRRGWRVEYLGADTPLEEVARRSAAVAADVAVLAASVPGRLDPLVASLARLAGTVPLAIAGAGASPAVAAAVGARLLTGDPVTEAQSMSLPLGGS